MRVGGFFYLGMKSILSKPFRSIATVLVLTTLIAMPLGITIFVNNYSNSITKRAENTPRFVVAKGSRFDQLMQILYYNKIGNKSIQYKQIEEINSSDLAVAIPIYLNHTIEGYPLVGVSSDYYNMRSLTLKIGNYPIRLGDCIVGSSIAKKLELNIGSYIVTDAKNQFDIAGSYPVRLRIRGILNKTSSVDDNAFFCGLKTSWLVDGLAHGHQDIQKKGSDSLILDKTANNLVLSSAVKPFVELNAENRNSFHFHGNIGEYPLSAIFIFSDLLRSQVVLTNRIKHSGDNLVVLNPKVLADELVEMIFDIKKIVDIVLSLSISCAFILFILFIYLSLQLREGEFISLQKLGCSRIKLFFIGSFDLLFYFTLSLVFVALITLAIYNQSIIIQGESLWLK